MKTAHLLVVLLLAGCAAEPILGTSNPNLLRVDGKPEGYPQTYVVKVHGVCIQVTESWREENYGKQKIWLKDVERKSMICPDRSRSGSGA